MLANDAVLDKLIDDQKRAIRDYVIYAVILVSFGFAIIAGASFLLFFGQLNPETFKVFFGFGGELTGFVVSSSSGIPIKEILNRRSRIGMFELIKTCCHNLVKAGDSADVAERRRVEDLVWKVVEQTAMG